MERQKPIIVDDNIKYKLYTIVSATPLAIYMIDRNPRYILVQLSFLCKDIKNKLFILNTRYKTTLDDINTINNIINENTLYIDNKFRSEKHAIELLTKELPVYNTDLIIQHNTDFSRFYINAVLESDDSNTHIRFSVPIGILSAIATVDIMMMYNDGIYEDIQNVVDVMYSNCDKCFVVDHIDNIGSIYYDGEYNYITHVTLYDKNNNIINIDIPVIREIITNNKKLAKKIKKDGNTFEALFEKYKDFSNYHDRDFISFINDNGIRYYTICSTSRATNDKVVILLSADLMGKIYDDCVAKTMITK